MRCINIDWLECYCIEDAFNYPHNADYFREHGWEVREREYGTPMYQEMFTLLDNYGEGLYEIRRNPKSDIREGGLFNTNSAHIRLCNAACYAQTPAYNLAQFLELNGFAFQRISRIDICLDLERFDYGDYPQKLVRRYMQGIYSKINQTNLSAHGLDSWDGRIWNSLSWGSRTSMVTTKFYNKTKELAEVKDKPYIRQAWQLAGLVDDMNTLTKTDTKGRVYKPEIWRVEFSVKSGTKGWFVVEDYNGDRKRIRSYRNNLQVYYEKKQILNVFFSLAHHYFHFKHVEYQEQTEKENQDKNKIEETDSGNPLVAVLNMTARLKLKRKDRCRDKLLFKTDSIESFYQIEKVCTSKPRNKNVDALIQRLYEYKQTHIGNEQWRAADIIISSLEKDRQQLAFTYPFSQTEIDILRNIISQRLNNPSLPFAVAKEEAEALVKLEKEIWNNPY